MPQLSSILESLDDLPEALREFYREEGDKFVLDLNADVKSHPTVLALQNAHDRQKKDNRDLKDKIKQLEGTVAKFADLPDDFDPEEFTRLKSEAEARAADPDNKDVRKQIDSAVAATKATYEAKIANIEKKAAADKKADADKISSSAKIIRNLMVGDGLSKALIAAGVTNGPFLKAAKAMLEGGVEVIDEDDGPVARMKADLGGEDIERFVTNWVQTDEGKAFVTPASGGGAQGGKEKKSVERNPFGKDHWNKTEQGQLLKSDRVKAEKLAKSAGFDSLDAAAKAMAPKVAA